jgi:hypothetical protein
MKVVYATTSATVAHAGQRVGVRAGEPWDASDPLVEQYPAMFAENVRMVRTTRAAEGVMPVTEDREPQVETATRGPGEQRRTRRTEGR